MQIVLFETGPVQNSVVPLHPVAQQRASALERFLRVTYAGALFCSDHLVYRLGVFGATVYDIDKPGRFERIGHYATGEAFSTMASLPGNRVVIAGQRLHVLDLSDKVSH